MERKKRRLHKAGFRCLQKDDFFSLLLLQHITIMLSKKIPFHIAILMTAAGIIGTFLTVSWISKKPDVPVSDNSILQCNFNSVRLNGYEYIRPLLYAEKNCESENLVSVKSQVESLVNSYKLSGAISEASVYIRRLNQGEWISTGENVKYNPGSLLKIPELITFMKMNERSPGLLDKKISYAKALNLPKQVIYLSKSIEVGKTYSVRELLYYMIAYSDNNATWLLNNIMDATVFKKVFTDLGIDNPDLTQKDIPITAKEFSLFMRVLYNSSYLNIDDSEYCTELLSHSDFNKGMISGLPKEVKVAHKFGEAGDGVNAHFNESGIIYVNKSPYLLTVMTKGKDYKLLPSVIADISQKVYQGISQL
ncbi:hypothetical protein BH11BAC4_BH11BAC4_24040 [soil metagenome]